MTARGSKVLIPENLVGQRFDKLLVVAAVIGRRSGYGRRWLCQCDCGATVERLSCQLKYRERHGCNIKCGRTKHGGTAGGKTRLWNIWVGMRRRCYDPGSTGYAHWGGRGITVCADWQTFEGFRAWALAHGYADHLTIDRINNDGNYEPSNCEWVTNAVNTARKNRWGSRKALLIEALLAA